MALNQFFMNIQELTSILCDMLRSGYKGILPGIGTFTLEDVPSEYSEDGNSISAPSKKVVFSTKGAGEATDESKAVLDELNEKGVFELPGFGLLKKIKGEGKSTDKITFELSKGFVADPDAFGLEDIHLDEKGRIKSNEEVEAEQQAKAEAEQKAKAEAEAEQKAKAQVEAEAKAKAEAEQQAKAQAEAKAKAEAKAEAEAKAKAARIAEEKKKAQSAKKPEAKAPLSPAAKALLWILAIIVILVVLAVVIYLFRESLAPYLKYLLYSKEELEVIDYML